MCSSVWAQIPQAGLLLLILSPVLALKTLEPSPSASRSGRVPIEGWVDVRLNHFNAANTATFPMRYYYNNEFASENIVIFVGGEWAISPGWVRSGLAYELAEATRAGLFYTEHRYYGLTRPTEDTGLEFLRFLTVDQALADLAQFIQYVKSDAFEAGQFRQAKVALVGCSYAGSMATWMRLAYPHLVDAVFSDSGPLHAQEDFPEYLEVITEAIKVQGGQNCLSSIEEAVQQLTLLLTTSEGPGQASQMFKTCSPINARSTLDLATFFWYGITETFAYLVQYAVPGDIPNACSVITNTSVANPVQRLANWITAQSWTQPCIETRYSEVVATHRNTSYTSEKTTMRLWTYQTCVEFGWYQTTTSTRQPFLTTIPLEYFHQMCRDFFALNINENLLRAGIERTNLMFGGLSRLPDKVVTVMGSHDPWSPMGPNVDHQHHLAPVFVVPQISHCRAIRPTGDSETEELERTKVAVLQRMQSFVTGIDSGASELRAVASMVIVISVLAFI
ncbi:putative serine protease K12H4.7 isoform X1 [Bombyx mori]|uniref:Serine protease K12H4.7 n=1 Tax=Bombyx mori TaxID=7091 RepID=A0A8R2R9G7_BOMMO|nr:putative serine protease K12H4.7 isoform X1 [Bombyx mori]